MAIPYRMIEDEYELDQVDWPKWLFSDAMERLAAKHEHGIQMIMLFPSRDHDKQRKRNLLRVIFNNDDNLFFELDGRITGTKSRIK